MEILNKLISSDSVQAIDKLLANIADTLNISVDMLKENGMHYVLEYGKYEFWSGFVWTFIFTTLIVLLFGILSLVGMGENGNLDIKSFSILILIITVILTVILIITSLPYIMSPEMYSIKQVIELLQ